MPVSVQSLWISLLFRTIILVVLLSLQWLVFRRAYRWAGERVPGRPWLRAAVVALFSLFNAALVAVVLLRPRVVQFPEWFRDSGIYPFFIWYAATFLLGVLLLAASIVKLPFWLALKGARLSRAVREKLDTLRARPSFTRFDASRRRFLRRGMEGVTVAAFAGSTYGVLVGKEEYDLTAAEFRIRGLDPAFDGFTIALVTDVHSSIFMTRPEMDTYVALINEMKPDIVVVGGDFVNGLTEEVFPFAESFSQLKTGMGAYGVMGNHDFYVQNPDRVAREVTECGIRLLHDERVTLRRGDAALNILGIDDVGNPARAQERIRHARGRSPLKGPSILLSHRPYFLPQAAQEKIDLMLSGHTHGGQVVFASLGRTYLTPAQMFSPYVAGEYRHGETALYVSRGIGTVGIPVRLNCPPEVTRITLRTA